MEAQGSISTDRYIRLMMHSMGGFMYPLIVFLLHGPGALKGGRNTSLKPVGSALPIFADACLGFPD
jgi:hypothetical protein